MMRLYDRFVEITTRRDFEYAELQGAFVALIWAVCFFIDSPGTELNSWPSYIWGILFAIVGFTQSTGLMFLQYHIRRIGSMLAVIAWMFAAGMLAADLRIYLCATCVAFAVGAAWGFIRIGHRHAVLQAFLGGQPARF